MAERILITGGAGFLGSALTARLAGRCEVVILDSLLRNAVQHTDLLDRAGVEFVRGDVVDPGCVASAARGCQQVVHMAAVAGVSAVEADPRKTRRTIVVGTDRVLEACREIPGLKRVVILSSSEVYGPQAEGVDEGDAAAPLEATEARWSYALGKLAAEQMALAGHRRYGLPVTVVRPFNVYGPGQVGEGAVHTFARQALASRPLYLHNGGRQVRAWCYIDDMIEGLLKVLTGEAAVGRVFNLGNPHPAVSVQELAGRVVRLAGSASPLVERTRRGPDVWVRTPDISRARRLLGFEPRVGLDEGLRRTLDWYRKRSRIERREAADG